MHRTKCPHFLFHLPSPGPSLNVYLRTPHYAGTTALDAWSRATCLCAIGHFFCFDERLPASFRQVAPRKRWAPPWLVPLACRPRPRSLQLPSAPYHPRPASSYAHSVARGASRGLVVEGCLTPRPLLLAQTNPRSSVPSLGHALRPCLFVAHPTQPGGGGGRPAGVKMYWLSDVF